MGLSRPCCVRAATLTTSANLPPTPKRQQAEDDDAILLSDLVVSDELWGVCTKITNFGFFVGERM